MKKIMLSAAVAAIAITAAAPAFAQREVTNVVGYVKTETIVNSRDALFSKTDKNGDGVISFKEFADASMFENEYAMFKMNDTNNDNVLSLEEFRAFSKQGPARVSSGPNGTTSNFNKPKLNLN